MICILEFKMSPGTNLWPCNAVHTIHRGYDSLGHVAVEMRYTEENVAHATAGPVSIRHVVME